MRHARFGAVILAGLLSIGVVALAGCERKGPGEEIGEAVEKVKDAVDPQGPAEKAGEKIDKALGNDH